MSTLPPHPYKQIKPQSTAAVAAQDEEFLRALHKTLFDVHVIEGACSACAWLFCSLLVCFYT